MQSGENRLKSSQVSVGVPDAVAERFQALLHGLVSKKYIPHAIAGVENGDGSFRWIGTAGDAHPDGTPMRVDTRFWTASVTKLYIAAVVLKLHESGHIRLNDSISAYLPQSLIGGIHRLGGVDYTDQITVHHLLGHTSGLPDYFVDAPEGKTVTQAPLLETDRTLTIEYILEIVRDSLTPHFPPQKHDAKRKKAEYSDTNYQLLIEIVETVTGQSLSDAFGKMLYEPLGLTQTAHPGPASESLSECATIWVGDEPWNAPLIMNSCGDICSTVDELIRFMRALVRGELFDDPATVEIMMGDWNTFGFSLNPNRMGWPIEYGLGMMRLRMPRIFTPMRALPAVVGHTGLSGSWLFYCPDLDVVLAGTVDQLTAGAVPFRFVPKLLPIIADATK